MRRSKSAAGDARKVRRLAGRRGWFWGSGVKSGMLAVRQNEQEVMKNIVAKTTDETRRRWETAIKDKRFDSIRNWSVCETRPEHFNRRLHPPKLTMLPHFTPSRWPSIPTALLLAPLADFHCSHANGRHCVASRLLNRTTHSQNTFSPHAATAPNHDSTNASTAICWLLHPPPVSEFHSPQRAPCSVLA